jgi:spore coat polysaccharide biosynthesis protein SpsF (cytidylyltransferase family)
MSKTFVFIQARTSSNRLFGKVLLPIRKIESILLLYKRIKSQKYKTIILTSNHKSDNYLCKILENKKVDYFRGSLNNVRKRFLQCAKSLDNEDVIVRVTGDNLFIDKHLILLLLKEFKNSKKNYLNIDRKKSKLPYGIAAEVFKLKTLKHSKPINKDDLEHVTLPIKRDKNKTKSIIIKNKINLFNERCTCDLIEDYLKIKFIFENYGNTHFTKWDILCKYLKRLHKKKIILSEHKKIIIGTAQFGSKYGINNNLEDIKQHNVNEILNYAKN